VQKAAVEGLGVIQFADIYRGRRVLITGHTGFKGSWLALWLCKLGATVTGIALDPENAVCHWNGLVENIIDHRQDIRDAEKVRDLVSAARPEIVFHLAAQPLVRRSYNSPLETIATNVLGTANVLDACRHLNSTKAIVAITTDKVYENREWTWGYRENDQLGGGDPYSTSKAAAELVVECYRKSFFSAPDSASLASARAGNVIGGGDWSEDRLIPDVVRYLKRKEPIMIRYADATRPWQHVLDCLAGYLLLGQKLLEGNRKFASAWNFGPNLADKCSVKDLLERLQVHWPDLKWQVVEQIQPHESMLLYLDHTKAATFLGWQPVWDLTQALRATATWYQQFLLNNEVISQRQLKEYVSAAAAAGAVWVKQ